MTKRTAKAIEQGIVLVAALAGGPWASANPSSPESLLTPPNQDGPVVVRVAFDIHDINEIHDVEEMFAFTAVRMSTWIDPRQAFTPTAGMNEKVFQGKYQFNELAAGWYPQMVLVNESGLNETNGVVLRVQPDGTSTLIETINATAESELDLRWFPFDNHRLEAVFQVLGFDRDEVLLEAASEDLRLDGTVRIPQWRITGSSMSVRDRDAASALVVSVDIERDSFYVRRLITFPLAVIVLLSFSVFWMDRSSVGDRISVSFIGILTGVAYQLVMGNVLPHISYFTLIHAFLGLSFMIMSATVVISLVVGTLDKNGDFARGDRIDRRCRWIFPLTYFGMVGVIFAVANVIF